MKRLIKENNEPRPTTTGGKAARHTSHAKLPKLNLPSFSGDIMIWTIFWDFYEAAVHSDSDLSDVEKFFVPKISHHTRMLRELLVV